MGKGFPSMTALLGLLAVAGFQNRDKLSELLGGGAGARDPQRLPSGSTMGAGYGAPGSGMGGMGGSGMGGSSMGSSSMGGGLGGILGNLGGLLGGAGAAAGAGGLLSGGLKELVDKFRGAGHGETVDSWVSSGPNREIAPRELEGALGDDTLDDLARQTGLSRQEIVERLSRELPNAVDRYTPSGRIPGPNDLT